MRGSGLSVLLCACVALLRCVDADSAFARPRARPAGPTQPSAPEDERFGLRTVAPASAFKLESAKWNAPPSTALLARERIAQPAMGKHIVHVDAFGAKGDGVSDDTEAIRRAAAAVRPGATLLFTAGRTYRKSGVVVVDQPDVQVWGYGATLYTVVTDEEATQTGGSAIAIFLRGARDALYGLTMTSNLRTRPPGHPNTSGVVLEGADQVVMDNRFEYIGLSTEGARRFVIARNVVYRSITDGIHMTGGSSQGRVLGNVVRQTGDDMIAIVSYGTGEPSIGGFLVEGNDVAGNYWGRGISVVGGQDVVIRDNRIDRTQAAAILMHSETSWSTANVHRVVVEKNVISNMETQPIEFDPLKTRRKVTGHAAIDVFGQGNQQVTDILIRGNTVRGTRNDAIFVRGNACRVRAVDNVLEGVREQAIHVDTNAPDACPVSCAANTLAGKTLESKACRATAAPDQTPHAPIVVVGHDEGRRGAPLSP